MKTKCVNIFNFKCAYIGQTVSEISEFLTCFARADNGKMRAANESYALKMNIIVILKKSNILLNSANMLETLLQNVLLCDLMTGFAKFPKCWLSLIKHSTLRNT